MSADYDFLIKLLVIGDAGVGKSSLLLRYSDDQFVDSYVATIGLDFKVRTLKLDGYRCRIQVWDTAGQERFRTITTSYYRGAHGILLVYDVSDKESYDHVRDWMTSVRTHAREGISVIIAGNKCDVTDKAVTREEAEKLSAEYGATFMETSAKANINVEEAFVSLARSALKKWLDEAGGNKKSSSSNPADGSKKLLDDKERPMPLDSQKPPCQC